MPPTTYHLRNESGIEVFTGTIVPAPGGGSQPGALASVDFIFTEEAADGVYTATWAPPDGAIVVGGRAYLLKPWATFSAVLEVGDADHADGYVQNLDLVSDLSNAPYDPTNAVGNSASAEAFPNGLLTAGTYQPGEFFVAISPDASAGPASGGVLYGASFDGTYVPATGPITMTLTTTGGPVSPTGSALVKIVYFAPVTTVAATFA